MGNLIYLIPLMLSKYNYMSSNTFCPVPTNQQPLEEFKELTRSWFFSMPFNQDQSLYKSLVLSWIIMLLPSFLIGFNSIFLRNNPILLTATSSEVSLLLPLILLIRQWLGWSYINKRLISQNVEYEETGGHDGQFWEKPLASRQQDLLIANHEVKPILKRLEKLLIKIFIILSCSTIMIYIL